MDHISVSRTISNVYQLTKTAKISIKINRNVQSARKDLATLKIDAVNKNIDIK